MRRRRTWVIAAIVLLAVPMISWSAKDATTSDNEELYKELDLFEHALSIVRSDYVEEPKAQQLIYGALKGMLATLDPYSQFLDPDSYNELKVDTEGEFGGLGVEITLKDDLLTIISPIDDTPADHAGLRSGDRIVKIDGQMTRGITIVEAVRKLRGKPNTKVVLTLLREGESELKDVTVERAIIKVKSIKDAEMLNDHIGYIRLSDFGEHTVQDLESAINQLKTKQMESLVFDLRNNPGGLLDVAVSVSELFLNRHQLIVTTKGRLRNQNQELRARIDGPISNVPLVVLINEGSASASEIVAGAIQDHHRGIVLGTKSHGKASVQTIFPLKDGSALRLTTSKYFTPSGRSIHGQGIPPDVEVPFQSAKEAKSKQEETKEIFDKLEPGTQAPDSPAEKLLKDNQVARAVDLLKGIRVYQSNERLAAAETRL